jgi:GxxExxY protein
MLMYEDLTYAIRGACFEVYKHMGCGFLEAVYQECLSIEFEEQGIPFQAQKELALDYKGRRLTQNYIPDLICDDKIIVEIKAVKEINKEHKAQVLNYLHGTQFNLGLLVNFGHYPQLECKRIILSPRIHHRIQGDFI